MKSHRSLVVENAGSGGASALANSNLRVVYVASSSFSGSTLLALLLNAHRRVVSIGEMGPAAMYSNRAYPCSCGALVTDCDFFRDIGLLLESWGVAFDPEEMNLRVPFDRKPLVGRILRGHLGHRWVNSRPGVLSASPQAYAHCARRRSLMGPQTTGHREENGAVAQGEDVIAALRGSV